MAKHTAYNYLLSSTILGIALVSGSALAAPATPDNQLNSAIAPTPATTPDAAIENVRIEGNQRIEGRTIVSYLGLQAGSSFSQEGIDSSLKNLYATGFFSDVKLLRSGNTLVVRVVENPVISKVAFEGNYRIETPDLEKEMELKPRSIYSQEKVQSDVNRVLDIYRKSGRYNATVQPKLIKRDQNRVDLVYEITEGSAAYIEKIAFIGNNVFSDSDLQKAIRTEETRWYKFFTDSDKYDSERLQYDQELLRRYYLSEGYVDFQVKSAHAELSPKKDSFYVTFAIEEGEKYDFGEINVTSELKDGEKPDFSDVITTKAGSTYDVNKVDETIEAMVKRLGDKGYAFVDIQPKLEKDREKKIANITYVIKPGPRVYVERVNVTGNVRTLDEVVRREIRLSEGDAYNSSKLQRSEQRINNLNFFEKVDIKTEQGSSPDKTVINVDVKEKSTGEVTLGGGYSSTDGVLADFGVKEQNLLGRGQELKSHFTLAARRKQADIGFTEPYFLDREIAAGFDIFRIKQDLMQQSSYDMDTRGFTLRATYALQEKLQHGVSYSIRENNVADVKPEASRYIRDQAGNNVNSSIGQNLTYDDRNNKMDPSSGYYARFSQEVAGLGGDSRYLRHDVKLGYFYPITKKWRTSLTGSGGYIFGIGGRDVRINDRFFVGGDDLRGFQNSGIGPRDTSTNDSLGGNAYYVSSAELKFPLGLPDELGISGVVFGDVGSLWQVDDNGANIFDSSTPRVSAGAGLAWSSPFGPIRIDYARALKKESADRTQNFRFSFGTRF